MRLHSAPLPTVLIAMYVPGTHCRADKGDYFTRLSIMNKQDYVRWFSGELMIGTKTFDSSLRPAGHHEVGTPVLILPRSRHVTQCDLSFDVCVSELRSSCFELLSRLLRTPCICTAMLPQLIHKDAYTRQ